MNNQNNNTRAQDQDLAKKQADQQNRSADTGRQDQPGQQTGQNANRKPENRPGQH